MLLGNDVIHCTGPRRPRRWDWMAAPLVRLVPSAHSRLAGGCAHLLRESRRCSRPEARHPRRSQWRFLASLGIRRAVGRVVPFVTLVAALVGLESQTNAADAPALPVVTYNVALSSFEDALPHGVPFQIQFTLSGDDAEYDSVTGRVWESGPPCATPSGPQMPGTAGDKDASGKRKFVLSAPRLKFSTSYCFVFGLGRKWTEADGTALGEAAQEIISAAAKRGSYNAELVSTTAKKSLDWRADLRVVLVGTAPGEKPQPLLDLVLDLFKLEALKPLFDAQRGHQNAIQNIRTGTRELIGLDQLGKLFGSPVPADVLHIEEAFAKTVEAAQKAKRLSEDISEADRQARLAQPPAELSKEEQAYLGSLNPLIEKMRSSYGIHCKDTEADTPEEAQAAPASPTPKRPGTDRLTYCTKLGQNIRRVERLLELAKSAKVELEKYGAARTSIVNSVAKRIGTITVAFPPQDVKTATPSYTERSAFYISADVDGTLPIFGSSGGTDLAVFLGVSVSFTAVDKDVPLREDDGFWKRFSLTTGWTLTDVQDSRGTAKGILGGKGLMLGGGLRVTDYLRLGSGAMFVRQNDSNPVVANTHVRAVPYFSLSIDIDVAGTIRGSISKYQGNGK